MILLVVVACSWISMLRSQQNLLHLLLKPSLKPFARPLKPGPLQFLKQRQCLGELRSFTSVQAGGPRSGGKSVVGTPSLAHVASS